MPRDVYELAWMFHFIMEASICHSISMVLYIYIYIYIYIRACLDVPLYHVACNNVVCSIVLVMHMDNGQHKYSSFISINTHSALLHSLLHQQRLFSFRLELVLPCCRGHGLWFVRRSSASLPLPEGGALEGGRGDWRVLAFDVTDDVIGVGAEVTECALEHLHFPLYWRVKCHDKFIVRKWLWLSLANITIYR